MTVMNPVVGVSDLTDVLLQRVGAGDRFAGLYGTAVLEDALRLTALVATADRVEALDALLPASQRRYPALTPKLPAAFWYERELHDLYGVVPDGHPRLEPLVVPPPGDTPPPHVAGTGLFTIPHGPVRSGVFESVEYLVETPGEDIPHLRVRVHYKHRDIESRFEELDAATGVLLAERVEGIATVAHALAYSHALEALSGVEVPVAARWVRVIHAELERIANHLDVAMKLADAAGLAVAVSRLGWHKERVLRLVGRCCGSRFGRGVVIPGGVLGLPGLAVAELRAELDRLQHDIGGDLRTLMGTSSFLDRLRRTGPLPADLAREHGALGPIGRASGYADDARELRPYDGYDHLGLPTAHHHTTGDALARLRVRIEEIDGSFHLLRQAVDRLDAAGDGPLAVPVRVPDGRGVGWAEAPQGEVVYAVEVRR
jgi:formate hydrogenlyase subunit 5